VALSLCAILTKSSFRFVAKQIGKTATAT